MTGGGGGGRWRKKRTEGGRELVMVDKEMEEKIEMEEEAENLIIPVISSDPTFNSTRSWAKEFQRISKQSTSSSKNCFLENNNNNNKFQWTYDLFVRQ